MTRKPRQRRVCQILEFAVSARCAECGEDIDGAELLGVRTDLCFQCADVTRRGGIFDRVCTACGGTGAMGEYDAVCGWCNGTGEEP